MIWTILGFGAIGGVIACQLKQHGEDVRVILPKKFQNQTGSTVNYRSAKQINPIRFQIDFHPPNTLLHPGCLIVTTKAYDVLTALQSWQPYFPEDMPILLFNNGMGVDKQAQELLPNHTILTAITEIGAMHREHCSFRQTGQGATWLGSQKNVPSREHNLLLHHLKRALPQTRWTHFIRLRQWRKLAINSIINPLSAKHNVKNGQLLAPEFRQEIDHLCAEMTALLEHMQLPTRQMPLLESVTCVLKKTAENSSSMRQDILNRRRTEIDLINGYALEQAQQLNLNMPLHTALFNQIKELEQAHVP